MINIFYCWIIIYILQTEKLFFFLSKTSRDINGHVIHSILKLHAIDKRYNNNKTEMKNKMCRNVNSITGNYLTLAQFPRVDSDIILDVGHISSRLPFAVQLLSQTKSRSGGMVAQGEWRVGRQASRFRST